MSGRPPREHTDRGAVLVLSLVFLLVGSLIVGGITYAVGNDLQNSTQFKAARSLQYAASSAVNQAIQSIRYTPLLGANGANQTLNASPPSYCWGTSAPSELTNIPGDPPVEVWCSTLWVPTSAASRVVTISACPVTESGITESAAACAQNPELQAVVTFDDYPAGLSSPTSVECDIYCGTGMKINSWNWNPAVPTVTGLSVTNGPVTGGTVTTVTGNGFTSGATVNFVEEKNGVPTSDNAVLAGTAVTVNSATSLTVTSPSMTAGTHYFVTVNTPTGTSAQTTSAVFTYTPVTPVVTSLSATTGYSAGGTSVTITGSGFIAGSVVNLYEESNGTVVSPTVVVPATNVSVNSDTTITFVTPSVTSIGSYYVTVLTPAGTSAYSSAAIFTFQPLVPTVASISPTSGPTTGGTAITITGTGFVTGATVNFVREYQNQPGFPVVSVAATNVVVTSSSTITALSPAISSGQTYFVTVTTPTGTSNYYPVFTYN